MSKATKPEKPTPDFPLFAHNSGSWAKKVEGRFKYFGPWSDPKAALDSYQRFINGTVSVTPKKKSAKPAKLVKPYKGFPLTPHDCGQWVKSIKGKTHYFGPDAQAALDKWLREKDDLLAGRKPRAADPQGLTVGVLVNHFLNTRQARVASGEIKQRTVDDYKLAAKVIAKTFGKERSVADLRPEDFERLRGAFSKTHGPVALSIDITRVRVIFGYAARTFEVHVRYGESFNKPTKAVLRRLKAEQPRKFFEAPQIQAMLAEASKPLKAMIMLGINCAFGNNDCATIGLNALDLDGGWHKYARPKTGIARRSPLWPETVEAIQQYLAERPRPKLAEHTKRLFITASGNTWEKTKDDNPVSKEMAKLLKRIGLHESGRGFYSLRHTFQTVGDGSGQMVAVRYVMGHAPASDDMAAIYREETFEENLLIASKYVRAWTFKRTQPCLQLGSAQKTFEPLVLEQLPNDEAEKPRRRRA